MTDFPHPSELLPHRPPFLLCDEIVDLEPGVSCTALWHLTGDEAFFAGHFPGRPTLPGVLIVESLAQTAGLAALSGEDFSGKLPLFGGIDKARFRRQVIPGDTLTLTANLGKMSRMAGKATGEASVAGELACKAEMMFIIANTSDL
ncbi:MAG TPA: 3-hydroxyacyl-[acyl-carrier-protein] dehydratase FabZ [Acidimicrobiaceae bacterium]|nr:3-hydroxyacyl-[acyl-carrier-protein] dehydratase FabZ [Acidimicrobiaceae bacterium]HAX06378.1 3-hydroxyacyl-[acyl-carrier-protein] dehydratase FabZ [Acidimicrobiaceae bacterium]|tara:strand:- start:451 stop:888 length:438 start_codon:yes stop_codon:yes gene_type:complete